MQRETRIDVAKTSTHDKTNGKKTTQEPNLEEQTQITIYITPCTDRKKCKRESE